jgi:spore coat protein CotH
MKNLTLLLILSFFPSLSSFAQINDESWKIYSDNKVARIDISIDPSSLEWIYNNVQSDSLHIASMHYTNNYINETVDSIGFRIRGNTSRVSQKKSFKVSFNTFIPGREFYGVDKLNLNGEHNDPSIIRSKLCFDLFQDIGMITSRAIHTEVYINGNYYGLYISVEHIDNEFLDKNFKDPSGNLWKCLYPADLTYIGEDNKAAYELKTNEEINDYSQLARLIEVINITPDNSFPDSLEKVLAVPEVLKYFAMNILVGHWDDYWSNKNNYYLYHSPSEDKFHWIPYDYDNTLGISWAPINWATADPYNYPMITGGDRPLATRIMANSQYRNLYTHFLEFYRENIFKLNIWESKIDSIKSLITPYVLDDTYRTMDYGYTMDDFNQSFTIGVYENRHVKKGLKQFINERYNSLPLQLNYISDAKPIVYDIKWTPEIPKATDSIFVTIAAFSYNDFSNVEIHYYPDGSSVANIYPMSYEPISESKKVEENDRWVGVIPPLGEGNSGAFRVFVKNVNNHFSLYPRHKPINISSPVIVSTNLIVNEFCADNDNVIQDEAGEYDDWIEIYNPTTETVMLSGMYLTDKPDNLTKWQFPENNNIAPGEFLIIWCDEEQEQGSLHTNFALSANGEFIGLTSSDGVTVVDSITFGSQTTDISYGRSPDAANNWQFFNQPTPGSSNNSTNVEDEGVAEVFILYQNYPNPFNPVSTINYSIKGKQFVKLKVFDVLGEEVAILVNVEKLPGNYQVEFNANNLPSGVYFYRLEVTPQDGQADKFISTKKMILLK